MKYVAFLGGPNKLTKLKIKIQSETLKYPNYINLIH